MKRTVRLAFSGSGFLAGIHAGAAAALLDEDFKILEVAGTSGGSIVASAVALGMNRNELLKLAVNSDMSKLLIFTPLSLFRGAWCNGNNLEKWLNTNFAGARMSDATMPVQILSTDVKGGGSHTFTNGDPVSFAIACRASSAVPFIYEPVHYMDKVLIDGGVCNNIPVDKLKPVGIRLGIAVQEPDTFPATPLWKYAGTLVKLLLASNEDNLIHLSKSTGATVLGVDSGNAGFLDTQLPLETKEMLFHAGYNAVMKQLRHQY